MADTDWGWKKRAELTNEDDHERPISLYQNYLKKKARGGYKHRPYYGYVIIVTLKVIIGKRCSDDHGVKNNASYIFLLLFSIPC